MLSYVTFVSVLATTLLPATVHAYAPEVLTATTQEEPHTPGEYCCQCSDYLARDDFDRAIREFTRAIEPKPDYTEAYEDRGRSWAEKGVFDRATADYTRAIALKPDYAEAFNTRAMSYYFEKGYDEAWWDVKRCRELGGIDGIFL